MENRLKEQTNSVEWLEGVLNIEQHTRFILNDALGRYVRVRENLGPIMEYLGDAREKISKLPGDKTRKEQTSEPTRDADRLDEVLRIEMYMRLILDDALGRYIHDSRNLGPIMDILGNAREQISKITGDKTKGCPDGYMHVDCACVPHPKTP